MKKVTTTSEYVAGNSYVEWGPVIAGAFVALAITAVLVPFGNALGLSVTRTLNADNASGMIFGIGLWVFWTQLISSIIGGYIAGKTVNLRASSTADESEFRDGAHGLLSWAVATVITAIGIAFAALFASLSPAPTADDMVVSAELARRATVVFGFVVTASSIVSGVAAWIFATIGGDHRDNQLDLSKYLSFRSR